MSAHLFEPLTIRSVTFRNRIFVSPMCQYSSTDGFANDWHFVHLGSRAVGGAALVIAEATAAEAIGRISPQDLGIWKDEHIAPLAKIVRFVEEQGAVAGIQLAHAGRKASTKRPWEGMGLIAESDGGWKPVAPSAIPFQAGDPAPHALTTSEVEHIVTAFAAAARRAREAGFRVVEIHAAHGYLLHEFLSPLTNQREDRYGGSFENRTRVVREVASAIREVWPAELPLFIRISATDWIEGSWSIEDSITLTRMLMPLGVDLIDCSSAGLAPGVKVPIGPGYQTPLAEKVRAATGALTGAVGLIVSSVQADHVIRSGQADAVLLARAMLRNPYWPLAAAAELRQPIDWPAQYLRARD